MAGGMNLTPARKIIPKPKEIDIVVQAILTDMPLKRIHQLNLP
jgi:hypothetical protein